MRAVWLSTTFYMDPAIESLTMAQEQLYIRALAYCGAAETGGYVSARGVLRLGVRGPVASAEALVKAGLWEHADGGGWQFRSWSVWQKNGDDLVQRRKADRERQARRREVSRDSHVTVSRDKSRDVRSLEKRREEKNKELSSAKPPREDVELLCKRLSEHLASREVLKFQVTTGWRTAARLMLDADGRDLDKALRLLDWTQADPFWSPQVLSMPKFREKYDQLRLKALKDWESPKRAATAGADPEGRRWQE
jgi:hypothetical protein